MKSYLVGKERGEVNESQSGDVLEGFSFHQHGQDLGRIYWIFAGSVIPVSYLGYVTRILRFSGDSDSDLLEFVRLTGQGKAMVISFRFVVFSRSDMGR